MSQTAAEIVRALEAQRDESRREGMARFGINADNALGISIPTLKRLARPNRRNHELALALWACGIHEARILAVLIEDPGKVSARQMDEWTGDFDSWDVCDQACLNLYCHTPHAWKKARQWATKKREFVKRAGFALMACLAVHDKDAGNQDFESLIPLIEDASDDNRNFVRKSVNWALRQIGKRNATLRKSSIACAKRILKRNTPASRWIARDALRELAR